MPVPTNGVTEEAGMPSKEELTQQPGANVSKTVRDHEDGYRVLNLEMWERLGE